ncbi:MAG: bifunctional aspartate kinase/homoserine dehydrogenase I, partial [Rhodospirillaceae bacterium]|nr:bifunctional aspartate kinase/homoserine dehydrogenase I [Rhodospirillaceae bacterium]
MSWTVHKFGGSSLADADCFRRVAGIVRDQPAGNLGVVVSAVGGVTDMLFDLIDRASRQQPVDDAMGTVRQRHVELAYELLGEDAVVPFMEQFETDLNDIKRILEALALVKATSRRSQDMVSGFGELWSARLLSALLAARIDNSENVRFIDARDVLTVEPGEMGPVVVWERTRGNLAAAISPEFNGVAVITGYIARNSDGLQSTLGRNGSDYSASIFAALLKADAVHIWTDVDGVMSGDPRRVPEATVIDEISYNEAMELAYFGARVIHPQTMAPAVSHEIPIRIRSTFNPHHPGSHIIATPGGPETVVKGISGIDSVALVNLEGAGMIGVPGTADRLFGALRDAGISVMLISQGSSEHSICFAVPEESADLVKSVVEDAFALELAQAQVQKVDITRGCGVLAVVGDGMAGTPGVSGRFFATLGKAGINVRAIAQGASERNISAVISSADMTRALRTVHASFYLSAKTVSIGLIGPGSVGSVLLDQMAGEVDRLREDFNLDLRVRGLGGSRCMALDDRWVDLGTWRTALEQGSEMDLPLFVDHVQADHLPHAVLVDCTADASIAARYADWLQRGIHVITPNKRAHSDSMDYYRRLKAICRNANTHFLYETTVGAGLPVIKTLRDLVETGDDIASISGIFSGTLAYL